MKLYIILFAILLLLVSEISRAGCEQNVQKVNVGTPSPCTGWIVSEPQMQKFAKQDDDIETYKKLNEVNTRLQKLDQSEIEFYKQRSTSLAKDLEKSDKRRFWSNMGYFILGVTLTGIAAKTAIEVAK